jgi:2-phospho-L-lactate guanylyltransferase
MWALIPVKSLRLSKQRLATLLSVSERGALVLAMLDDVLDALAAVPAILRVRVLTDDQVVAQRVRNRGHQVVPEQSGLTLNENLNRAARHSAAHTQRLLVIPADVPAATAADVELLLAAHRGGITLAPAVVDGGTNALLLEPPDVLACQFGPDSCARHQKAARAAGVEAVVVTRTGLARDLDRPDDLHWLMTRPAGKHTTAFLTSLDVGQRLAAQSLQDTA